MDPPEIPARYELSELAQAEYLPKMLDAFDALGLHGASIYQFIAPDVPHAEEHKQSFHTVAHANRTATC